MSRPVASWDEAVGRMFARAVPLPTGCLIWPGATNREGYGVVKIGGRSGPTRLTHRVAYESAHGPIPEGKMLDHLCWVRRCLNPQHLDPVDAMTNARRGRAGDGLRERARTITHCPQGHPYSPENTYRPPSSPNSRQCRSCMRARRRAWGAARRENR